jgi:hypothetical protein
VRSHAVCAEANGCDNTVQGGLVIPLVGECSAAGYPSVVSAPGGHGMILTGECVDIEDTTYRVI